jgi:hypothetical protein
VLRRSEQAEAEFFQLDLTRPLEGEGAEEDMLLLPSDIVYVPKSFIADVNVFVDQYIRQNIAPFTLYIEGWNAFNLTQSRVIVRR